MVVKKYKGNFINSDDDNYSLPQPNDTNNGRILDCMANFVITPPINDYHVEMIVTQDGIEIGKDSYTGNSTAQNVNVKLLIQLEQE